MSSYIRKVQTSKGFAMNVLGFDELELAGVWLIFMGVLGLVATVAQLRRDSQLLNSISTHETVRASELRRELGSRRALLTGGAPLILLPSLVIGIYLVFW